MIATKDLRHRFALRAIVLVALAIKLLYLASYVRLPFLYGPIFDAQVYLTQARRVAAGQFGDATLLAFSPAYGYMLAAVRVVTESPLAPVLVQIGLGSANLVLLARVSERVLDARTGAFAAVAYLAYGPLLQFETKLMSETCGITLLLLVLERMTRADFAAGSFRARSAAGAWLGLAILMRASLLPMLPGLALVASARSAAEDAVDFAAARRRVASRGLAFVLGTALVLTAHGAWTQWHSGLFVPTILVSETASRASQRTWSGRLDVFADGTEGVSPFDVVKQAEQKLRRVRRGEPPLPAPPYSLSGALRQLPSKLWLTLRDQETSFDYGFYGERSEAWPLRLPFASFGMLLSFGLLGVLQAVRDRRTSALRLLGAVALGATLTCALIHPSTRYRLPLALALMPFAAHAWVALLGQAPSARRTRWLAVYAAAALGLAAHHELRGLEHPGMWQLRVAEAELESGDGSAARRRIHTALALESDDPDVRMRAEALTARMPPPSP